MAIDLYYWRRNLRFIAGMSFLVDYLKNQGGQIAGGWNSPFAASSWGQRIAWYKTLQDRLARTMPNNLTDDFMGTLL